MADQPNPRLSALGHSRRGSAGLGISGRSYRAGGSSLVFSASGWAWAAGWDVVFCGHAVAGFRLCRLRLYAVCFCRRPLSIPRWPRDYGCRHRRNHVWRASPVRLVAKGCADRCSGSYRCAGAADLAAGKRLSGRRNPQSPHHRAQSAGTGCLPQLRRRPL